MKFRVVSGDLNVVIQRNILFQDITQELLIAIIKEALNKTKKDYLEFGELLRVCECPLTSIHNCYFIETKSAIEKAGYKIEERGKNKNE